MIKKFLATSAIVALILTGCAPDTQESSGVVIVNARVIDGSGAPSRNMNVRIVADRIAALGHHDAGLAEMQGALAVVSQGITTIVAGQDGGQQYPLAQFFDQLQASPAAINVASYAGHGTLRGLVMGDDYKRHATPDELTEMVDLLRIEMNSGALGLSSGLEYDPGSFSAAEELVVLASEAARHDGRYISHIRSEDQYFWEAIDEVINIGREARLPVQVTHIKLAMTRWWGQADRLLGKLDEARASGVSITADIYPYRAWNSGFGWLTTLFPDRDLDRRDGAEYILRDMLSPEGILLPDFPPEPAYDGLTIAEIAHIRESDPETTLMDLLKADRDMGSQSPMLTWVANPRCSVLPWTNPISNPSWPGRTPSLAVMASWQGRIPGDMAPLRAFSDITFVIAM